MLDICFTVESFIKKNNNNTRERHSLLLFFTSTHTLIIQEEKYSHLRLRIKATFHSGAFFKTLNYSFLEEGCDQAQAFSALTGCFHVWRATSQPACQLTNQPTRPDGKGSSPLANQPNRPGEQNSGRRTSQPLS